jgi:chromosome segregation ATPase
MEKLENKVDKISDGLDKTLKEIEPLSGIADMSKTLEKLADEIKEVRKDMSPLSDLDKKMSSLDTSKDIEAIGKKVDTLETSLQSILTKMAEDETQKQLVDVETKIDSFGDSLKTIRSGVEELGENEELETLGKKIEDLQQYVASLSTLEEKVKDLASAQEDTKEIVGILVRQLDDLERKYNKSLDKIDEVISSVQQLADSAEASSEDSGKKSKVKMKSRRESTEPVKKVSESTVDELMETLLKKVDSKTEARDMGSALERVRDELTDLISMHTPVLHQVGKVARELKSYPPTATLNENDIARLNKEIRTWTTKLKEVSDE